MSNLLVVVRSRSLRGVRLACGGCLLLGQSGLVSVVCFQVLVVEFRFIEMDVLRNSDIPTFVILVDLGTCLVRKGPEMLRAHTCCEV